MSLSRFSPELESPYQNCVSGYLLLLKHARRVFAVSHSKLIQQTAFVAQAAKGFTPGVVAFILMGCGGGDDFSKPTARLPERTARSSADGVQEVQSGNESPAATQPSGDEVASHKTDATAKLSENSSGSKTDKPKTAPPSPAAKDMIPDTNASAEEAGSGTPKGPTTSMVPEAQRSLGETPIPGDMGSARVESPKNAAAPPKLPAKGDDAETMTASGRTAKSFTEKQEENSKMSVAENAGGLLGSLKGSKSSTASKAATPTEEYDAPQILSRFGRMALSQPDWLRLVTRLSRRFYMGTSLDGSRILVSSGERSGSVIQVDVMPEKQLRYGASHAAADEELQRITSLPGRISCLELIGDGTAALFGTDDGRVLVRMISGKQNWDLYARDLFLFQDEIRPSARLGAEPIVLLREISGGQLLSIDAKGQCGIWKIADIVQAVPPIDSISVSNIDSLTSATMSPPAVANFEIKGFQILSCCESADGQWVAIVSSDESISIIETQTGAIVDQLNAKHFADTQPVTVAFLPDRQEILAGLADGRILRRAFGKEVPPVSGVNDKGEPVDFDAVFIPDFRDRPDPITSIALIPGTSFAYVGSLAGSISRLDVSQRRMDLLPSKAASAILELKVCSYGTLSISDERRAIIFDRPVSDLTRALATPRTMELPTDERLSESSSGGPEAGRTGRSTARTASVREPVDEEMFGIRPSDLQLALLHHQLRTSVTESQRQPVRRAILAMQGRDVRMLDPSANVVSEENAAPAVPTLSSEFTTNFDYTAQSWQDVRMTCSLDGRTVVLSHDSRPGILIVDMPTGVVLRRWTGIPAPRQLLLNEQYGRLVPSGPAAAELNPGTGAVLSDVTRRYLVCALSPDRQSTILGHFGNPSLAANALTRIDNVQAARTNTHEMFESMVTALAYSSDGDSLYAAFRGRDQTTLQELDPSTLAVRTTLIAEPLSGAVPQDFSAALEGKCGTTLLLSSVSNRSLLTYGTFEDGPQLRLWRRSSKGWPKEDVTIFRDEEHLPDAAVLSPVVFVSQADSKLAVVTKSGLSILNTKKEKLESQLAIPDVGGRRPSCCFTPNAKWILVGDGDGTIWVRSLISPTRKPLTFQAHSGPIAGLSISADGKLLLTAGEDNRIRSWSLGDFP